MQKKTYNNLHRNKNSSYATANHCALPWYTIQTVLGRCYAMQNTQWRQTWHDYCDLLWNNATWCTLVQEEISAAVILSDSQSKSIICQNHPIWFEKCSLVWSLCPLNQEQYFWRENTILWM